MPYANRADGLGGFVGTPPGMRAGTEVSPVTRELTKLLGGLSQLDEELDILTARLEPVLSTVPPHNAGDPPLEAAESGLVNSLLRLNDALSATIQRVESLRSRLVL